MESLKKIISLNQASQISGYTQDHLGYLIRKGEMKGIKKGRTWFTTEEELNNYIFKKKIRSEKFALKEFFSPARTKKIIIMTIIVLVVGFVVIGNLNKKNLTPADEIKSAITSDGEAVRIKN